MGKVKDHRYANVRAMINAGDIRTFEGIFVAIPKTVVAKDIGKNTGRMTGYISNPKKLTLEEIEELAGFIGILPFHLMSLIYRSEKKEVVKRDTANQEPAY